MQAHLAARAHLAPKTAPALGFGFIFFMRVNLP